MDNEGGENNSVFYVKIMIETKRNILIISDNQVYISKLLIFFSGIHNSITSTSSFEQGLALLEHSEIKNQTVSLLFLEASPTKVADKKIVERIMALIGREYSEAIQLVVLARNSLPDNLLKNCPPRTCRVDLPVSLPKLRIALNSIGITLPKLNCWKYKKCGRGPGGRHVADLGSCPIAEESKIDGLHGGEKCGRACWSISGTLCGGEVQGTFAKKMKSCKDCDFYMLVKEEEGDHFVSIPLQIL